MKKMRKLGAAIAMTLATSVIVSACGSTPANNTTNDAPENDTSDRTITFWMQPYGSDPSIQRDALEKVIADFKVETGITVEYNIVDWNSATQKLTLACTGGEAPDVADIFFTNSFQKMSSEEYGLLPVDDLVEEMGGESTWITAAKDEACVDGTWYGIPWRADTRVLLYNTEDFANAGIDKVPETWDELVEAAQKLTEVNESGEITHAGLAWYSDMGRYDQTWFSMLAQAGGEMMNSDFTEFTFDSDAGKASLQFLSDCINEYNICNNSLDASYDAISEFMSGNVSMVFGVTGEVKNNILTNAPQMENKFASAPLPTMSGTEKNAVSYSAPIAIFKTTQDLEASKEWVKYFCSEEVQLYLSQQLGILNSNINVMNNSFFVDDPWLAPFTETLNNSQSGDMPLTTWSQLDAWPDGPIPTMCAEVVNGTPVEEAIATCLQGIHEIGF